MKAKLKSLFTPQEISPFMKMGNLINIVSFIILFGFLIMGAVQHTLATFVHVAPHYSLFKIWPVKMRSMHKIQRESQSTDFF